jgi:hypothetical protein
VDDVPAARGGVTQGVDVGHDVVPKPALVEGGGVEVHVVEVGAKLRELLGLDPRRLAVVGRHPELGLRLGQRQPEPPPGAEFAERSPPLGHLAACVACDQGIVVARVGHVGGARPEL